MVTTTGRVPVRRIVGYLDHQLVKTCTAGGCSDVEDLARDIGVQRDSTNGDRANISRDPRLAK